ncbi:hypothetical protein [Absidia glauca]|uniref:Uncharacterized protein n=1 Tax=Absidia glauca TaxID=4829 RepID=A0A163TGC8_ABSGL|nr:hypothetical protein [Absidia glauca]
MYRRSDDQLQSSRILVRELRESMHCEELMFRSVEGAQYFGFKTGFFELLVRSDQVTKYHVDSTYRSNNAGFELFGIVANVYGSGYPIAYLLMKINASSNNNNNDNNDDREENNSRIGVLKTFFSTHEKSRLEPDIHVL